MKCECCGISWDQVWSLGVHFEREWLTGQVVYIAADGSKLMYPECAGEVYWWVLSILDDKGLTMCHGLNIYPGRVDYCEEVALLGGYYCTKHQAEYGNQLAICG